MLYAEILLSAGERFKRYKQNVGDQEKNQGAKKNVEEEAISHRKKVVRLLGGFGGLISP